MFKPAVFILFACSCSLSALEIRNYDPDRHDRFVSGSQGLALNPNAYFDSSLYTGVGYGTDSGDVRQFALVTPEHILYARHYSFFGTIAFLNADGTVITRSIISKTEVPNSSGGSADVMLAKLSAPLMDSDKITPLPYLKLNSESQYTGRELVTFGRERRGGHGVIAGFQDFESTDGKVQQTRAMTYNYTNAVGNGDDAYAETGDSGSPTFVIENGAPALVGIHSAILTTPSSVTMLDGFVPHYDDEINSILANEGYRLIRANPDPVNLALTQTAQDLRQAFPGSISFDVENTSNNEASNVRLRLVFPLDAVPDGITAPGWVVENPATGEFHLRRATLASTTSSVVTASFAEVPVVGEISIQTFHNSDGSGEVTEFFTLPVEPTFAGYVDGLSAQGVNDDPDQDGFSNLLEYAFGGDPAENEAVTADGISLHVQARLEAGEYIFSFPRRTDATARGLDYEVQFSDDLSENSFSSTAPPNYSTVTSAYDPPVDGFEAITGSFPVTGIDRKFIRVSITLNE